MTITPDVIIVEVPGLPGPAGAVATISTDVTMAADSDVLVASQKATKARIEARTLISGFTTGAAIGDTDTFGINQGAGNLKQTFAAIKTWIKSWIVKGDVGLGNVDNTSDATKNAAAVTLTNKTLTTPTINGAAVSGSWSGNRTRTGLDTITIGNATTVSDYLNLQPSNFGTGNYKISLYKESIAAKWVWQTYDGVDVNGILDFNIGTLTKQGSPIMTRANPGTITGIPTISTSNATTLASYLQCVPTDYTVGKPAFYIQKSAAATQWNVTLFDSATNNGLINFAVSDVQHNGLPVALNKYGVYSTDADFTLPGYERNIIHIGTLTANRAMTLSSPGNAGATLRVTRTSAGAFTLNVGGLKTLATNTWCDVTYNGSAWILTAYGAL